MVPLILDLNTHKATSQNRSLKWDCVTVFAIKLGAENPPRIALFLNGPLSASLHPFFSEKHDHFKRFL